MTNREYENRFNSFLKNERKIIVNNFNDALKVNEMGFDEIDKIDNFQNKLIEKKRDLMRIQMPDKLIDDRYYQDLVNEFRPTRDGKKKKEFYVRFFKEVVPFLQRNCIRTDYGAKPEMLSAGNLDLLNHIAKYDVLRELLDSDILRTTNRSIKDVRKDLKGWRNGKKELNVINDRNNPKDNVDKKDKPEMGNSYSKAKTDNTISKQTKTTQNKLERYKLYFETYNYFTKIENLPYTEAEKKTCEKHKISPKTLDRALNSN